MPAVSSNGDRGEDLEGRARVVPRGNSGDAPVDKNRHPNPGPFDHLDPGAAGVPHEQVVEDRTRKADPWGIIVVRE